MQLGLQKGDWEQHCITTSNHVGQTGADEGKAGQH